jgi:hypothetical protein
MTSRRQFLIAGAAGSLFLPAKARAAKASASDFPYTEFEARSARRDFRDMTKDVLPTPCMVVDLDLFDRNVKTMADQCKAASINASSSRQNPQECGRGQTAIAGGHRLTAPRWRRRN